MTANLSPYLNFRGQAREALDFYASVFGGELTVTAFRDFGGMGVAEEEQDQVMHGQLNSDEVLLMCSDVPSHMEYAGLIGAQIALSGTDDETLRGWWASLSEGASIDMPLEMAPWGDAFGMLHDRFGVSWMINIAGS